MHSKKEAHMEKAGDDRGNGVGKLAGGDVASGGNRTVADGANSKVANNAASLAKWTFLVYMAEDNNLDGAALRDIAEMARAGSTKDVNILVQLDRIEDNLTRRFRIAGRVEIREGEMDALITTRPKTGYMLNFARENVLIIRKGDFPLLAWSIMLLLELDQFFADWSDWLLDMPEVLCLC
jgi:hypothetical protein